MIVLTLTRAGGGFLAYLLGRIVSQQSLPAKLEFFGRKLLFQTCTYKQCCRSSLQTQTIDRFPPNPTLYCFPSKAGTSTRAENAPVGGTPQSEEAPERRNRLPFSNFLIRSDGAVGYHLRFQPRSVGPVYPCLTTTRMPNLDYGTASLRPRRQLAVQPVIYQSRQPKFVLVNSHQTSVKLHEGYLHRIDSRRTHPRIDQLPPPTQIDNAVAAPTRSTKAAAGSLARTSCAAPGWLCVSQPLLVSS